MGITPVRALNSKKVDGIGGVANNPVEFWVLRKGLGDSILGKRLTFLGRKTFFLIKVLYEDSELSFIVLPYRRVQSRLYRGRWRRG